MANKDQTPISCLVLTGYGVNCEKEMALAAELAGAQASTRLLQDLLHNPNILDETDLLLFPGGFSFGDELGAAKVYANKIAFTEKNGQSLKSHLESFVKNGGAIFGVCNGFQLLVKLGLLPGIENEACALTHNQSSRFENRWCQHRVNPSPCIFTQGLDHLYLPVRHGEGCFVSSAQLRQQLFESGQAVLQYSDPTGKVTEDYPANPNGSKQAIAGICDPTGRVFGMMAHPEAFVSRYQHPSWTRMPETDDVPDGLKIFQRGIQSLREQKSASVAMI